MTTAQAKKHIKPEHFQKYLELGGKLKLNDYRYVAANFIKHTLDVFISGDCTRYPSRQAAVEGFQKWVDKCGYRENWQRVFKSIDLVTPYT